MTPGIDLNEPFETGNTALHMAINNGKIKIVQFLIKKGVDVNLPNKAIDGATALHMAVISGMNNLFHFLLKSIISMVYLTNEKQIYFSLMLHPDWKVCFFPIELACLGIAAPLQK